MTTDVMDEHVANQTDGASEGIPLADAVIHLARCATCGETVRFKPLPSGFGFSLPDPVEATYGVGPEGRPECPHGHGEMEIADDKLPADEAFALAQQQLDAPVQRSLPGIVPPFNFEGAYLELEGQALRVDELRRIWEDDAKTAKESKQAWEKAADVHNKMALELRRRRLAKAEPASDPDPNEGGAIVACLFEQRNPQVPCPLCDGSTLGLDETEIKPRDSEGHVEQALEMIESRKVNDLVEDLDAAAGIIVTEQTVRGWSQEDRETVQVYIDLLFGGTRPERPKVLGASHIADEPNHDGLQQICRECGSVLLAFSPDGDDEPYPTGKLVGVDCPGAGQAYPKKDAKKKATAKGRKR